MKKNVVLLIAAILALSASFTGCDYIMQFIGPDDQNGTEQDQFTDVNYKWFTGTSAPAAALGSNGDLYMNTATGDVYVKTNGSWANVSSIQGPAGPAGSDGSTWITGPQAPASSEGNDGDLYLDTSTNDVYKKTNNSWTLITNIQGDSGSTGDTTSGDGTTWHTGTSAPSSTLGEDGDFYLNTATNELYTKESGSWGLITTIGSDGGTTSTGMTTWEYMITSSNVSYSSSTGRYTVMILDSFFRTSGYWYDVWEVGTYVDEYNDEYDYIYKNFYNWLIMDGGFSFSSSSNWTGRKIRIFRIPTTAKGIQGGFDAAQYFRDLAGIH